MKWKHPRLITSVHSPSGLLDPPERAWVGSHLQIIESLYMLSIVGLKGLKRSSPWFLGVYRGKASRWLMPGKWNETPEERVAFTQSTHSSVLQVPALEGRSQLLEFCLCHVSYLASSSLIKLLCLSKAHTIHIISIQIQNLSDYCSECNVIQGFFPKEHLSDMHLILCAICKCHHCSC